MDTLRLDESDDTETLNGTQKYRELWKLENYIWRGGRNVVTLLEWRIWRHQTSLRKAICLSIIQTSFESNTESIPYSESSDIQQRKLSVLSIDFHRPSTSNLLHPNYESRRQTYKNILARRLHPLGGTASAENSIDSVETVDTDGDVSRY